MAGMTGAGATVYNGFDFIVKEIVGLTTFTMKSHLGISTTDTVIWSR